MHAISKPVSHICNASLNQGICPNRLKFTIVKLIYKIGGKNCSKFKPTLFLITSSNMLEKVMHNSLSQHLYVKKTVTPQKFNFQKNCNTVQQFIY
jgi:hypothetical protein